MTKQSWKQYEAELAAVAADESAWDEAVPVPTEEFYAAVAEESCSCSRGGSALFCECRSAAVGA